MRQLPQQVSLLAVSVLVVATVAVAPVSARNGQDDTDTTSTAQADSSSSGRDADNRVKPVNTDNPDASPDAVGGTSAADEADKPVTGDSSDLQERAKKLLASERKDKKSKSIEARQKSCEARQASLMKKSQNYSRNAKKHLGVFDSVYAKVLAFQQEKQLTAANFAALKAAADAKKAAAGSAITALESPNVTVDCSSEDPAEAVATLRESVKNARQALQEYRSAIKDLVVALQAAKTTDDTTTEAN